MNLKQICILTVVVAAIWSSGRPGYAQPEQVTPTNKVCTPERLLEWQHDFCDPSALQPIQNYQPRYFPTVKSLQVLFDSKWTKEQKNQKVKEANTATSCNNIPYNLERTIKALLTMYEATQDRKYLEDAVAIANALVGNMKPYDVRYVLNGLNPDASTRFLEFSREVEGSQSNGFKIWNTEGCRTFNNKEDMTYRYMEVDLQGMREIARLAQILSKENDIRWRKFYDYAFQSLGFYAMRYSNINPQNPNYALDPAIDKRQLYISGTVALYEARGRSDERLRQWGRQVLDQMMGEKTLVFGVCTYEDGSRLENNNTKVTASNAGMQKLGKDFVFLLWNAQCPNRPGTGIGNSQIIDTSHANRHADMIRALKDAQLYEDIDDWVRRSVNTLIFKIAELRDSKNVNNPKVTTQALPKVTPVFNNFTDGNNCFNESTCVSTGNEYGYKLQGDIRNRGRYGWGNVTFGWVQLARYDARVLAILENLVQTLSLCDQGVYPSAENREICHTNNSNGTNVYFTNAIAELAYDLKLQGR